MVTKFSILSILSLKYRSYNMWHYIFVKSNFISENVMSYTGSKSVEMKNEISDN